MAVVVLSDDGESDPCPENAYKSYTATSPSIILSSDDECIVVISSDDSSCDTIQFHGDARSRSRTCKAKHQYQDSSPCDSSDDDFGGQRGSGAKRFKAELADDHDDLTSKGETIRYFENNSCLPIFHKGRKKYSSEQIITTLFNSKVEDCDRVCTAQPYGCEENCSFIVDLSKLNDSSDIKSDDLGSWKNMGVHCVYASVGFDNNDCVQRVNVLGNRKPKVMRSTIYKLKKTYWRHKVANDFSRKMFELLDYQDKKYELCLFQYQFDSSEHSIPTACHGNSKSKSNKYYRTKSSVRKIIEQEGSLSLKPSELFDKLQGDVCSIESCGSVPRNRQQVSNIRKKLKSTDTKDTLFAVMEACKKEQSKSCPFIRRVITAPEPICLLCNDKQLQDIERFCCDKKHFSVLGIDATFNLGDFLVTITTYRHLLLKECSIGKPPVMIGPALVHQSKKTETYHALASGIVGLRPALINLLAFGTDGEVAIGNAFALQFQQAVHLLCFIHVKRDIQRKLHDLGVNDKFSREFINEIFGYKHGCHYTEGLVDCDSPQKV